MPDNPERELYMSEQIPEQQPETGAAQETDSPATDQPSYDDLMGKLEAYKRVAAEQERRAKANAEKAKEFDAYQESQKTEQQKIADRAAAAERARDEAVAAGLRYKAAATHGIGEDYFDLLGSGDEEAITARAERVGELLKARSEVESLRAEVESLRAGRPTPRGGRPVENLRPGATPSDVQSEDAEYAAFAAAMNLPNR